MPSTIWIDVEDLFEYARANARPSGIQRVAFEICQAMHEQDAGAGHVHFVRHAPFTKSFTAVGWNEVADLFAGLTRARVTAAPPLTCVRRDEALRQFIRLRLHRLPADLRAAVTDAAIKTAPAGRAWGRLLAQVIGLPARSIRRMAGRPLGGISPNRPKTAGNSAREPGFAEMVRPGDVILVLGSPWFHPDYAGLVQRCREHLGVEFGLLVHDLIPLRRPEWCDRTLARLFRAWFTPLMPLCDHLFTVSQATARDLEAYAAENRMDIPKVTAIPIGTGLRPSEPERSVRDLPAPGSYALIVSTIEIRKNHLLLFRVWRRLLEELPRDSVPKLVFAGRIGWLVEDLMRQIANSQHLDGKLVVVESPTDAELERLYRGCLFTLFPSFHEGWGLPVTESLAFGKPCLISNATSLPEAGGTLARSFDPDNLHDAYAAIRTAITDRDGLARWEEEVRRSFKPVPWSATARTLLSRLQNRIGSADAAAAPASAARLPDCLRLTEPAGAALQP